MYFSIIGFSGGGRVRLTGRLELNVQFYAEINQENIAVGEVSRLSEVEEIVRFFTVW